MQNVHVQKEAATSMYMAEKRYTPRKRQWLRADAKSNQQLAHRNNEQNTNRKKDILVFNERISTKTERKN